MHLAIVFMALFGLSNAAYDYCSFGKDHTLCKYKVLYITKFKVCQLPLINNLCILHRLIPSGQLVAPSWSKLWLLMRFNWSLTHTTPCAAQLPRVWRHAEQPGHNRQHRTWGKWYILISTPISVDFIWLHFSTLSGLEPRIGTDCPNFGTAVLVPTRHEWKIM